MPHVARTVYVTPAVPPVALNCTACPMATSSGNVPSLLTGTATVLTALLPSVRSDVVTSTTVGVPVSNSPDRMDALVWGGYELLGDGTDTGDIRPSQGSLVVTPDDDIEWAQALNEIQGNSEDLW